MKSLYLVSVLLHTALACAVRYSLAGAGDIHHLARKLSTSASITLPGDAEWDDLTAWSASPRIRPDFVAVVRVMTEGDVQETVSICMFCCIGSADLYGIDQIRK